MLISVCVLMCLAQTIIYRYHIENKRNFYDAAAIILLYILLSFNLAESYVQALPDSWNQVRSGRSKASRILGKFVNYICI